MASEDTTIDVMMEVTPQYENASIGAPHEDSAANAPEVVPIKDTVEFSETAIAPEAAEPSSDDNAVEAVPAAPQEQEEQPQPEEQPQLEEQQLQEEQPQQEQTPPQQSSPQMPQHNKVPSLRSRLARPAVLSTVEEDKERPHGASRTPAAPVLMPSVGILHPSYKRAPSPSLSMRTASPAFSSRGPSPASFYTPPRSRTPTSIHSERAFSRSMRCETPENSFARPRSSSVSSFRGAAPRSPTPNGHYTPPASPERLLAPLPPTPEPQMAAMEVVELPVDCSMDDEHELHSIEILAPIAEVVDPSLDVHMDVRSLRSMRVSQLPTPRHSRRGSPTFSETSTFNGHANLSGHMSRINSTIIDRVTRTPAKLFFEQAIPPTTIIESEMENPSHELRYHPSRPPPKPMSLKGRSTTFPDHSPKPSNASIRSMPVTNELPFVTSASDLYGLWAAANGQRAVSHLPTYKLQMHRECALPNYTSRLPSANITFGPSPQDAVYSISSVGNAFNPRAPELMIERHCPTKPVTIPVTHLSVDANRTATPSLPHRPEETFITSLHPKLAILLALDAAAQSPAATALARSDPNAESPAAAQLAQQAVLQAVEREGCGLTWTPIFTNYATTAGQGYYTLHHPRLGDFPIEVRGDASRLFDPPQTLAMPNGQPFRTSGSISVLMPGTARDEIHPHRVTTLDMGGEALTLDTTTLTSFGSLYIMDICVAALFAVAAAETQKRTANKPTESAVPTFVPHTVIPKPPSMVAAQSPAPEIISKRRRLLSSLRHKRSTKSQSSGSSGISGLTIKTSLTTYPMAYQAREARPKTAGGRLEEQEQQTSEFDWDQVTGEEMPAVTKAALNGLLLGFKGAVWVLGTGVTLAAEVVIGVSTAVTKKP